LQQRDVSPLTVAMVDDYEALMALASRGHSLRSILLEKATEEWRLSRLENLLLERATGRGDLRLPLYEKEFEGVSERVAQRLFGESLART
jgi:hypothetical protein